MRKNYDYKGYQHNEKQEKAIETALRVITK